MSTTEWDIYFKHYGIELGTPLHKVPMEIMGKIETDMSRKTPGWVGMNDGQRMEAIKVADKLREMEDKAYKISETLDRFEMPRRFLRIESKDFPPGAFLSAIDVWLQKVISGDCTMSGLYLYGPSRSRKTEMAVYLIKAIARARLNGNVAINGKFVEAVRLWQASKRTYDETRLVDRAQREMPFLIVDGLGEEDGGRQDQAASFFYGILKLRYMNMLPIIVTSRISPKDLSSRYSDDVAVIVNRDMCVVNMEEV